MRVRKRTGNIVEWNERKIVRAMLGAFQEVNPSSIPNVTPIVDDVIWNFDGLDIVDIETIQDEVEKALMRSDYHDVAKAYVIYRHERAKSRSKKRKPDPDAVADYIHLAKYARYKPDAERRETFKETVNRVKEMHLNRFCGSEFSQLDWDRTVVGPSPAYIAAQIHGAFNFVYNKKVLPSMRSMQFGGSALEQHNARMYNCAFTLIDRPRAFQEIFYLLLAGCGVGYSVQWRHVEQLPPITVVDNRKVYHHILEDTIEGWADSVGALFKAFIEGYYIQFNYYKIRPEGAPLKTSGGLAPGHIALREALVNITEVLKRVEGRKLRPIECHDIICFIAEAVLSGGIRRSSLISLFSPEDTEMMYSKASGNFNPMKDINPQRMMANNSAVLLRGADGLGIFSRIIRIAQEGFGEPGFFWTQDNDYGTNPCGEIGLHPVLKGVGPKSVDRTGFSFCNLCEVNVAGCENADDFREAVKAAAFIGTLQAAYTDFPYLGRTTEAIADRDRLLGVGLTGMTDNPEIAFNPPLLECAAREAVETNIQTAELIGIRPAQRVTTVKPSGTASLELGCVGSGIHPHHAKKYFRRITANRNEPVAQFFIKANPHMVEYKPNGDLSLVFPVEAPSRAITVKDLPAINFLGKVMLVYNNWIRPGSASFEFSPGLTHNVSCTVTIRDGELDDVVAYIWTHRDSIAAMSFVPYSLDKKYPFVPREAIETRKDKDRWDNIIANYRKVDWTKMREEWHTVTRRSLEAACAGGTCEL